MLVQLGVLNWFLAIFFSSFCCMFDWHSQIRSLAFVPWLTLPGTWSLYDTCWWYSWCHCQYRSYYENACVTLTVEFGSRTCIICNYLMLEIQGRVRSILTFFFFPTDCQVRWIDHGTDDSIHRTLPPTHHQPGNNNNKSLMLNIYVATTTGTMLVSNLPWSLIFRPVPLVDRHHNGESRFVFCWFFSPYV